MLETVFNDADAYVKEERTTAAPPTHDSLTSPEKPLTVLEILNGHLINLHNKISTWSTTSRREHLVLTGFSFVTDDTRAADLERSRAKASLQALDFRLRYQRDATLRSGKGGRPRTLFAYFPTPSKP